MKYLALFSLFFLLSCGDDLDDNTPCSGAEVAGIDVVVTDAVTDEVLTFGVVVNVTEGAFSSDLPQNEGHFIGLYDQEGTFTLTVTKSGYQTFTEEGVLVLKPGCHSLTTTRNVALTPL